MRNPQYNKSVNIDMNKNLKIKYQKYQPYRQTKLFTNDIKFALFTSASSLVLSQIFVQDAPAYYILLATSLTYSTIRLYSNQKQKVKKFTIK